MTPDEMVRNGSSMIIRGAHQSIADTIRIVSKSEKIKNMSGVEACEEIARMLESAIAS